MGKDKTRVEKAMGIALERLDYIIDYRTASDLIPELTSYIDDVLPKKMDEASMELEVLDTVMEVEQYLQQIDAEE